MASGSGWNLWVWLAGDGCGWNLWVWLVGMVVRRYIDFLILLIPTPLVYICFFGSFFKMFFVLYTYYTYRQHMPFTPSEMLFSLVRHRNISQDTSWP